MSICLFNNSRDPGRSSRAPNWDFGDPCSASAVPRWPHDPDPSCSATESVTWTPNACTLVSLLGTASAAARMPETAGLRWTKRRTTTVASRAGLSRVRFGPMAGIEMGSSGYSWRRRPGWCWSTLCSPFPSPRRNRSPRRLHPREQMRGGEEAGHPARLTLAWRCSLWNCWRLEGR